MEQKEKELQDKIGEYYMSKDWGPYRCNNYELHESVPFDAIERAFKAGAEWMQQALSDSPAPTEYYIRTAWDRTIQERDELKNTNKALLAIKTGLERSYKEAADKLKDYEALSNHNKAIIKDLNAQRIQLKFKEEQAKDLKEKLGEAIKKNWLLEKRIEDLEHNIRRINNMSEVSVSDFTELIREADRLFETVGGSTRHYVSDCLLPLMEEKGMKLINT